MLLVIFDKETDVELKVIDDHTGAVPRPGDTITFLDGARAYEVTSVHWQTSSDVWMSLNCVIAVKAKGAK